MLQSINYYLRSDAPSPPRPYPDVVSLKYSGPPPNLSELNDFPYRGVVDCRILTRIINK